MPVTMAEIDRLRARADRLIARARRDGYAARCGKYGAKAWMRRLGWRGLVRLAESRVEAALLEWWRRDARRCPVPRERPILFSGPMVKELLAGRKTQTRRPVKPQPPAAAEEVFCWYGPQYVVQKAEEGCYYRDASGLKFLRRCPYGTPGDRLWVRENFQISPDGPIYRATAHEHGTCDFGGEGPWRPSIHMPRKLSRLLLEVTEVRVERLCAISEEDARAEGIPFDGRWYLGRPHHIKGTPTCWATAHDALLSRWDLMYGGGPFAWSANPWVWVVSFRRVEPERNAA